jgi:hypothetical protein
MKIKKISNPIKSNNIYHPKNYMSPLWGSEFRDISSSYKHFAPMGLRITGSLSVTVTVYVKQHDVSILPSSMGGTCLLNDAYSSLYKPRSGDMFVALR